VRCLVLLSFGEGLLASERGREGERLRMGIVGEGGWDCNCDCVLSISHEILGESGRDGTFCSPGERRNFNGPHPGYGMFW
jgi:hypothetical protein